MKKLKVFFTALMMLLGTTAFAQSITVKGVVSDASTGEVVPFASLMEKGTMNGVSTNAEGEYSIQASAKGVLVISSIGYTTQEVEINGQAVVNIALEPDSQMLNETIVVAFGTSTKESFTGSASVISSDDIAKTQGTNILQSVAGKVAGVQTAASSGAPGASTTLMIRGYGSINASNTPLYVVDGVPFGGDFNTINPNDIETMTVLKDAASNALYGSRGANGVVMITTKKGTRKEAVVNFDAKVGVNSRAVKDYNYITDPALYYETHYAALRNYYAETYGEGMAHVYANEALCSKSANGGLGYCVYTVPAGEYLIGANGKLNPNATLGNKVVGTDGNTYLMTPDNWNDYAYQKGMRQEYNFSVSGGDEKLNFFASLGYLNNQGIVAASNFDRLNGRIKADYQAKKWLKVGVNASFSKYNMNSLDNNGVSNSTGNIFAYTAQMAPIYPFYVRDAEGNIVTGSNGLPAYDFGDGEYFPSTRALFPSSNAIASNLVDTNNSEGNAYTVNGYVDINIIDGLKLTVNAGSNLDETRYTTVQNPYYGQFASEDGIVGKEHDRYFAYNLQQLLNYKKSFGKNNVEALLGHEYYYANSKYLYASKSRMFNQTNKELDGAIYDRSSASSGASSYNTEGFFARAQYDFDTRYFFSGSFRRDGSSRFAEGHQWGNFWSVGGAWIINKENWFNASWIDMLKVKASTGSQGNDGIGNYRYTDMYSIINSSNQIGINFSSKGNENITWETNINTNAGAEFEFFKGRLGGGFDFFTRMTKDMLFAFPTAPSVGYSSYYANVGDMKNYGLEFELYGDAIKTQNVTLSLNFNATTFKNVVTTLPDERKTKTVQGYSGFTSGSYFVGEGLSRYTFYMKEFAGVDPETGKSLWVKNIYADPTTEDEIIGTETTDDYSKASDRIVGDSVPALYGGFGLNLTAYGFDFSANFAYQIGGLVYDYGYAASVASPYGSSVGTNYHADVLNAWTPENKTSSIPRFQYGDTYCGSTSSRFLTSASYLNLSNITVGYTFPSKWTNKIKISSLRIYATADNLWYASARKGLDPRQDTSFSGSSDATTYSPMRTISGGINIKF